jgi:hypothetical protein
VQLLPQVQGRYRTSRIKAQASIARLPGISTLIGKKLLNDANFP